MVYSLRSIEPSAVLAAILLPLAIIGDFLYSKTDWNYEPIGNPRVRRKFLRRSESSRPSGLSASLAKRPRGFLGFRAVPPADSALPFGRRRRKSVSRVFYIVAILIVGAALFALVAGGFLPQISEILGKITEFLGVSFGIKPSEKVEASTYALTCAINQVAAGSTDASLCQKTTTPSPTGSFFRFLGEIPSRISGMITGYQTMNLGNQQIPIDESTKKCFGKDGGPPCAVCTDKTATRCFVEAFELPQTLPKTGVAPLDFLQSWVGLMGDPDYIIFYEAFPEGLEEAWTFDMGDWLLATVAFGGLLNLGGGTFKVAGAAFRAAGAVIKQPFLAIGKRTALSQIKERFIGDVAKAFGGTKVAGKYLTVQAARRYVAARIAEGGTIDAVEEIAKDLTENAITKRILQPTSQLKRALDVLRKEEKQATLADFNALIVRAPEEQIVPEVVQGILNRRMGAATASLILREDGLDAITAQLNGIRRELLDGTLVSQVDDSAKLAFSRSLRTKILDSDVFENAIVKKLEKADNFYKNFVKVKGKLSPAQIKLIDDELEAIVAEAYPNYERALLTLSNDKPLLEEFLTKKLDGIFDRKGLTPTTRDFFLGKGREFVAAGKGLAGFPAERAAKAGLLTRREKLMAFVAAVGFFSMLGDMRTDKYEVAEPNSLVISFPRFLKLGKTQLPIPLADAAKRFYVWTATPGITGDQVIRGHMVSPCKADLEITQEKIECGQYASPDTYLLQVNTAESFICGAGAKSLGKSSGEASYWASFGEVASIKRVEVSGGTELRIKCELRRGPEKQLLDTLEFPFKEEMLTEEIAGGKFYKPEIVHCPTSVDLDKINNDLATATELKKEIFPETCVTYDKNAKEIKRTQYIPIKIASVLNLRNGKTFTYCSAPGYVGPFAVGIRWRDINSIKISVVDGSGDKYKDYEYNYCRVNRGNWDNWLGEVIIPVGTIIASIGVMILSAGLATPFAIAAVSQTSLFAIGSAAAVAEKKFQDDDKWPKSQV